MIKIMMTMNMLFISILENMLKKYGIQINHMQLHHFVEILRIYRLLHLLDTKRIKKYFPYHLYHKYKSIKLHN